MATLDELSPGTRARIDSILASGAIGQRLLEMGLLDGEEIRVVGRAPLGDPLEIEVQSYRLSLRKAEASLIQVTRL